MNYLVYPPLSTGKAQGINSRGACEYIRQGDPKTKVYNVKFLHPPHFVPWQATNERQTWRFLLGLHPANLAKIRADQKISHSVESRLLLLHHHHRPMEKNKGNLAYTASLQFNLSLAYSKRWMQQSDWIHWRMQQSDWIHWQSLQYNISNTLSKRGLNACHRVLTQQQLPGHAVSFATRWNLLLSGNNPNTITGWAGFMS